MPAHTLFFLFALSFLSGIAYAALELTLPLSLIPAAVLFAFLYVFDLRFLIAFLDAILLVSGAFYYLQDDSRYRAAIAAAPSSTTFQGIIAEDPKHAIDYQSFYLKTDAGLIAVRTTTSPAYSYGDSLVIEGIAQPPSAAYYSRHVIAELRKPKIARQASGYGNPLLSFLFGIKEREAVGG